MEAKLIGRKWNRTATVGVALLLSIALGTAVGVSQESGPESSPKLPYIDTSRGRDGHPLSDHEVNSLRLYDYYSRQAEYYLDGHPVPDILPAYPGLDGGDFGHWGKYSKNSFSSDRWDKMDLGTVVGGVFRHGSQEPLPRAITARLGPEGTLAACFNPATLTYRNIWTDSFVGHAEHRWGLTSGIYLEGTPLLTTVPSVGWSREGTWPRDFAEDAIEYHGYYRHGKRVIFSYAVHDVPILDTPWARPTEAGPFLTRTLRLGKAVDTQHVQLFQAPAAKSQWRQVEGHNALVIYHGDQATACLLGTAKLSGTAELKLTQDRRVVIRLANVTASSHLNARIWTGKSADLETALEAMTQAPSPKDPSHFKSGGPAQWPETVTLSGKLDDNDQAYAIDAIPVPIEANPYKSLMFLSDIGFFDNGDAAICTITGDVWRVSGIDDDLDAVTWKRYASGLNQALGLVMVDNTPAVLGRDQITLLHDRNGDQEADFYESFCHKFHSPAGGHSFLTGLERDAEGNFYFSSQTPGVTRISRDGKNVETLATGIRNPNGLGVRSDGLVVTAPQEGTWTPTSMICEVNQGDFFGLWPRKEDDITPPICFVPRGVDPSTGGQCFVEDPRFGPLNDQLFAFSWNHCSYYMVLRDEVEGITQGAAVPLPGDFLSGAHRGHVSRHDGHLYVVCSDGWGTYATQHGALHRVRYTGKKTYLPLDFHAYKNGISITFSQELDEKTVTDKAQLFAQQWEYAYSKSYGSPEFSVEHPDKQGHDPLEIRSVHLLEDGQTLFLEIPDIQPVMQLHLHGRLKAADGHRFQADLFPTLRRLDDPYTDFPGYEPVSQSKPEKLALRIRWPEPSASQAKQDNSDSEEKDARSIVIKAVAGLQYHRESFRVRAGEHIALRVENTDVIPHNLVITRPDKMDEVGALADKLIADPNAIKQDYVPETDNVLHHTPVIEPDRAFTLRFTAPDTPGKYPYVCTFPGHWQVMNGTMIVE